MSHPPLVVIGSADGTLRALDGRDGALLWEYRSTHPFGGPALAQTADLLLAVGADGYVVALRLADGIIAWQGEVIALPRIESRPSYARARVCGETAAIQCERTVAVVEAASGVTRWAYVTQPAGPPPRWNPYDPAVFELLGVGASNVYVLEVRSLAGPMRTTPPETLSLIRNDRFLSRAFNALRHPAVTLGFDQHTGKRRWTVYDYSARGWPWHGAGASLVEADGVVYLYGRGQVHALEAALPTPLWSQEVGDETSFGGLVVGASAVFLAAGGHLGAYSRATGEPLWTATAPPKVDETVERFEQVLVLGQTVYTGRVRGNPDGFQLEARDAETGAVTGVWPASADQLNPTYAPAFRGAGGMLYVPSQDGLYAVRASDLQLHWSTNTLDVMNSALLAVAASD